MRPGHHSGVGPDARGRSLANVSLVTKSNGDKRSARWREVVAASPMQHLGQFRRSSAAQPAKWVGQLDAPGCRLWRRWTSHVPSTVQAVAMNAIRIGTDDFALVLTQGPAVHLARSTGAGSTLCSRAVGPWRPEPDEVVPTCRTCLRIVTRNLGSTPADPRLNQVADAAVRTMLRDASAIVMRVPGDQVEALRRRVRDVAHASGLRATTTLVGEAIFVHSEDAWDEMDADERAALVDLGANSMWSGRQVEVHRSIVDWNGA
jgi:hypothetical protein